MAEARTAELAEARTVEHSAGAQSRAQGVKARPLDGCSLTRSAGRAGSRHAAVQIREAKTVQIPREHAVLLVGDRRPRQEIADVHRVVTKFNPRGVVANKVRHLQHIARILIDVAATGADSGRRIRQAQRSRVRQAQRSRVRRAQRKRGRRLPGGGLILDAFLEGTALEGRAERARPIGEEVRAHRGAVQWRAKLCRRHRGRVPGGERDRLPLIPRRAHGDNFNVARLGVRAVDGGHGQALALRRRHRAGGVG